MLSRILKDLVGFHTDSTTGHKVDAGTDLALDRTAMAAERTLMAWIRTALAMISFGFTIGKLGEALAATTTVHLVLGRETDIHGVAFYLVVLGTSALIMAMIQNRIEMAWLHRQGLRRRFRLTFLIALLLSLLGIVTFTDLARQI